jgi:hypothetical protein
VCPCKGANDLEFLVEEVVAVPSISDAVVDDELLKDLNSRVAVEGQVFTVAIDDLAVLL